VRHGETDPNKAGRILGNSAAPLNSTGRAQARAIARALTRDLPFALYSSPLRRATETAGRIADALRISVTVLEELAEVDCGDIEGLTVADMRRNYPKLAREWMEDAAKARPPGGETMIEVQARVWRAVDRLRLRHNGETVVAVSHGFAILAIVSTLLGMRLQEFQRIRHDVGAIARLDFDGDRPTLISVNETWHLDGLVTESGPESNERG
jgi:probable phosphoglycerate mutase